MTSLPCAAYNHKAAAGVGTRCCEGVLGRSYEGLPPPHPQLGASFFSFEALKKLGFLLSPVMSNVRSFRFDMGSLCGGATTKLLTQYNWRPAVYLSVLDCGKESNNPTCREFWSARIPHCTGRDPDDMRRFIIDKLETQKESPPPACPPLEPIRAFLPVQWLLVTTNASLLLPIIVLEIRTVVLQQVHCLLAGHPIRIQLDNATAVPYVSHLAGPIRISRAAQGVVIPSGFLLCRNGSISKINLKEESRAAYTEFLRALPGVTRFIVNLIQWSANPVDDTVVRRAVNSSVIYMADLESSIQYSLRVEVARYSKFNGDRLRGSDELRLRTEKVLPARSPTCAHYWILCILGCTIKGEKWLTYKYFADAVK
ncbi:unnamed protein product [Ranitomeya imitator]|uniref:Uncharacterized protein n=1 Tax=Ranitomeya imitator TaxID=111125 RepID=A0ABN9KWX0_9NEOB|nr:unnamed protein product [Ranitomeya imitator]